MKHLFTIIEFIGFILPALPSNLYIRLGILLTYFIAHTLKLQKQYLKCKTEWLQLEKLLME